jgi:hypothetical protein
LLREDGFHHAREFPAEKILYMRQEDLIILVAKAVMRCIMVLALSFLPAWAGEQTGVVILYEFHDGHSEQSWKELQAEVTNLMHPAGFDVEWQLKTGASFPPTTSELVVVQFHGSCGMQGAAVAVHSVPGPMGITHVANGEVLPFSDVDCELVRGQVAAAMAGYDARQAERLLGRALGRVVAHELWHALTRSETHGRHGLMRKALSGGDLISDHMEISREDLERRTARQNARRQTAEKHGTGGG